MFSTDRLNLRGFRPTDKDFFLNLFEEHGVLVNLTEAYVAPSYYTNSDRIEAISKSAVFFVVEQKATHEPMGFALVNITQPKHLDGALGMALGEKWWNMGYGMEILEFLKPYCFNTIGLRRLSLEVYSPNEAAIALYKKAGFQVEGRKREAFWKEGNWVDLIWMGILSKDYYAAIRDSSSS